MAIVMRRARPDDFQAMGAIFRAAGSAAWAHIVPAEGLAKLTAPARWADAIASADPETAVIVAEEDGAVVGFVVARRSGDDDATSDTGEIDAFYTDPSAWSRGAGRALLDAACAHLRGAGFRSVTLWTDARNERPRRVYQRYGFAADGAVKRRSHLGAELVDLRYRLALASR